MLKIAVTREHTYNLARVKETFPDDEGVVRKVLICYKNYHVGESIIEYKGARDQECTRSVQRLALVVPVEVSQKKDA